ncbi:hypothetical protein [Pelagibaculum spongiae]|uniref:PIN domain-containing protein n=1 Tax=Pelagibaculum spongiae TaxID=2080658 RepID=A0A2V1H3R6_9GAMM|nr:hypothetical protein [Pelagibaculum spongiae]PVZ70659.1 hypothetical protein DC094_08780 [Pelagibaculum spongiae]
MKRHVVDTNVLIVASGEHPASPFASDKHPVEDPDQAEKVLQWLLNFANSSDRVLLDFDQEIFKEYRNKLTEQDYGHRVIIDKISAGEVDYIDVEWIDDPSHPDPVAKLPSTLQSVIHDLADTKMVAACISGKSSGLDNTVMNACDTDWYDWEIELKAHGVIVEQVIDAWLRVKWQAHHDR